jgi:hypothetical protein
MTNEIEAGYLPGRPPHTPHFFVLQYNSVLAGPEGLVGQAAETGGADKPLFPFSHTPNRCRKEFNAE